MNLIVVVTGYSSGNEETIKKAIMPFLEPLKYGVSRVCPEKVDICIINPCRCMRDSFIFRKFKLPGMKDSRHSIAAMKQDVATAISEAEKYAGEPVTKVAIVTYSYGVVAAHLVPYLQSMDIEVSEMYMLSPPLGYVIWSPIEKVFSFLPGFRELENGAFKRGVMDCIRTTRGTKYMFILPRDGDNRVGYDQIDLYNLEQLNAEIKTTSVETHRGILNEDVSNAIVYGILVEDNKRRPQSST